MARYRTITPIILMLSVLSMGGCAWLQQPVDEGAKRGVDIAQEVVAGVDDHITEIEQAVKKILDREKQLEFLGDTLPLNQQLALTEWQIELAKTRDFRVSAVAELANAKKIVNESKTNGDMIIAAIDQWGPGVATLFGAPMLAMGYKVFRQGQKVASTSGENGKLKTAIANVETNKNEAGFVDWKAVKSDNYDVPGLNKLVDKIRKG